jgi:hypothetical protein
MGSKVKIESKVRLAAVVSLQPTHEQHAEKRRETVNFALSLASSQWRDIHSTMHYWSEWEGSVQHIEPLSIEKSQSNHRFSLAVYRMAVTSSAEQ